MPIPKSTLIIVMILLGTGPLFSTSAQGNPWGKLRHRRLVRLDWNCASASAYPSRNLDRIVKLVMKRNDFSGVGSWGDRAFAFDLNGDRRLEYFVPLDCGATGNCVWGVFATNPARELGVITGKYIYVHRLRDRWPELVTYGHFSAVEGSLTTYRFGKRRYSPIGPSFPISHWSFDLDIQGGTGNKMPSIFERARAACESVGS